MKIDSDFNIKIIDNLENIIEFLPNKSKVNTVILYSPASPSMDSYKNFEERGNHFKQLIYRKYEVGNN